MADAAITDDLIRPFAGQRFSDSAGLDTFFKKRTDKHYIKWFNGKLADKGPWKGVTLVDTVQNDLGFHQFWNQTGHMFGGDIGAIHFVCLMSIISNEVKGDFTPQPERMGTAGHKGMAYLFDRIGRKRSYNTLDGNQTAFQCFNDPKFLKAHGSLPLADKLARTKDKRWSGEAWPAEIPTDPKPSLTGFIGESDFMKFRGRGFIQTTGRANYLPLIEFVQNYTGENSTIDFFQHRWSDKTPAEVAFGSTNADWDTLFQKTDLVIATEAIRVHNANSSQYLKLASDAKGLNGTGRGSVHFMGLKISGGEAYAKTFKQRVIEVLKAIDAA